MATPPPRWPPGRLALAGFALAGLALAVHLAAALHPEAVERLYARGLYPALSRPLSGLTALLPFSVAEILVVALPPVAAWRLLRRRRRWREALATVPAAAGVLYLTFLVLWGLNYQRQPFALAAGLDVAPVAVLELEALGVALVEEANEARRPLSEDAHGVMRLAVGRRAALDRALAGVSEAARLHPLLAGGAVRPKPVFFSRALSALGVTGLYFPFTAEANLNMDVPDPELPFAASHELAHARGFAREDEANYLGYLACRLHPDPDFRYSGLLSASLYALSALHRAERAAYRRVESGRSAAVRRDIDALEAWSALHRGPVQSASRRVNDAYLRSQGQREGVRSYGRMVDLLLAERRARH